MRQIHQMAIALARALHLRQNGQFEDAIEVLRQALSEVSDADFRRLLQMSRMELLDYLGDTVGLAKEEQCSIADMLYEYSLSVGSVDPEASTAARERAAWIYADCVASGATLPLHVHERLGSINPESSDEIRNTDLEDVNPGEDKS